MTMNEQRLPSSQNEMGPAPTPGPSPPPPTPGWQAITADTLISAKPVILYGLIVTATIGAAAVATFYDGVNAAARRRFRVNADFSTSQPVSFGPGILMQYGLFVTLDANTLEVLVLYDPVPDA